MPWRCSDIYAIPTRFRSSWPCAVNPVLGKQPLYEFYGRIKSDGCQSIRISVRDFREKLEMVNRLFFVLCCRSHARVP